MKLRALVAAGLLALASTNVLADFSRVGPLNTPAPPGNGFPKWYQDLNGLFLDLCLPDATDPGAAQQAACLLTGPGLPTPPYVFPTNFPDEAFYFRATSLLNTVPDGSKKATLVLALEAAFANGAPAIGDQMVFARIRVTAGVPFPGTYRVIHPWGEEKFVDVQVGGSAGRDIVFTEDVGITAGDFRAALKGRAGPFLTRDVADPATRFVTVNGAQFLSDGLQTEKVTGSRFGTNLFMICGPFAAEGAPETCIQTDQFTLTGRVHDSVRDPIGTPMAVERATYARDANGTRVDVSASALAAAGLPIPKLSVGAVGLPPVLLNGPTPLGYFYAQGLAVPPEAVPGVVTLINSTDNPPSVVTHHIADEVTVSSATYDPATGTLTVVATSSDKGIGLETPPSLALEGFPPGLNVTTGVNVTVSNRGFVLGDPASVQFLVTGLTVPPASATVISTAGGVGRQDPAIAATAPFPAGVPLAIDDIATATAGGPAVSIPVVANDLANALAPITTPLPEIVAGGLSPAGFGTLTPLADGNVLFQPSNVTGIGTFKYVVSNGVGKSNPATVTITVQPGAGGPTPLVSNDPLTGSINVLRGGSVVIDVLANDTGNGGTLDPASVLVTPPTVGTATVNPANGSIAYSNPAGSPTGLQTFTYTVANTNGKRSAAATVSVNIVAETATATSARCSAGAKWDVRGTASASSSVTLYLTGTVPAAPTASQILGTATVDATGAWRFTQSGSPACRSPISAKTSLGTKIENIAVRN